MSELLLHMGIDVSGNPGGKIYVGLISIHSNNVNYLRKQFKKNFPKLISSTQKGTKRKHNELLKLIYFLDGKTKMYATKMESNRWFEFHREYKNSSYLNEKVYALLYFQLISHVCHKNTKNPYNIVVCVETTINTDRCINYLKKLLKANKYNVLLTQGRANYSFLIKLADFIAASYRKVNINELKGVKNFYYYDLDKLNHFYYKKLLKKN